MVQLVLRSIAYFRADLRLIVILFVMIGASVALNLMYAWPMAVLIDSVLSEAPKDNWIHRLFMAPFGENRMVQVAGLALIGMLIKILQDAVWGIRMLINARIRLNGTTRVKTALFDKLQELELAWHRSRSQGDTMYRLSMDSCGPWGILDTLIGSSAAMVTLAAMTVIMLSRSASLTLVALSITPLLMIANAHFRHTIRVGAGNMKKAEATLTTTLQQAVQAIGLIQAYGRQKPEARRFSAAVTDTVESSMALAWQENLYPFIVHAIFAAGGAAILTYGGWLVYQDQFAAPRPNGVSVGDLIVFMAYLGQLWDPLGWVLGFSTKIQTHAAGCARVFEVLDEKVQIVDDPDAQRLPIVPRKLTLNEIRFGYTPDRRVLDGITADIESGEFVAFVGASGTGKSTLLSLLHRMYDPDQGVVLLDEYDVREIALRDVRQHIAVVGQDSPLFPDTIAANLRYGRPDALDEEVLAAARAAGAAEFIESLPHGYDTIINEGGSNLSGGQRQRLVIARALLSRAPILVLDEPTSSLDPEHEQWIVKTLNALRGSRTIVLVTHRLESVSACDRIFVLKEGRIVESGSHKQLITLQGEYAKMLRGRRPLFEIRPTAIRRAPHVIG